MVTVLRQGGFRVVIYLGDHDPAHVHVYGDGHAKVNLAGPVLVLAEGMTSADIRKAFRLVEDNRDYLLQRWSEIHG
jgi:hypothetical protein